MNPAKVIHHHRRHKSPPVHVHLKAGRAMQGIFRAIGREVSATLICRAFMPAVLVTCSTCDVSQTLFALPRVLGFIYSDR